MDLKSVTSNDISVEGVIDFDKSLLASCSNDFDKNADVKDTTTNVMVEGIQHEEIQHDSTKLVSSPANVNTSDTLTDALAPWELQNRRAMHDLALAKQTLEKRRKPKTAPEPDTKTEQEKEAEASVDEWLGSLKKITHPENKTPQQAEASRTATGGASPQGSPAAAAASPAHDNPD